MKRRDTKKEIIRESYKLFRERGFNDVSIQDICDACDITKPTFYNHIPSKEHLLSHFFSSISEEIPESWFKVSDDTDPLEKIREGFLLYIDRIQRLGLDLYNEQFIANLSIHKSSSNDSSPFMALITDLIAQAQQQGEIRNPDAPAQLASNAISLAVGYGAYWCLNNGRNDLGADMIEGLDALFLSGEVSDGQ